MRLEIARSQETHLGGMGFAVVAGVPVGRAARAPGYPRLEGNAPMMDLLNHVAPLAAAGYSLIYLLLGGGLGGAILIFIIAKMLGK